MDLARRLIQLTMLAIVAMAVAAPPLSAQIEPLAHNSSPRMLVKQEIHAAADFNCTTVGPSPAPSPAPIATAGGCRTHMTSPNTVVTSHIAAGVEVTVSTCAWEAELRLDIAGEGYMPHQELTGPAETCTQRPCGQLVPPTGEGRAWSIFMEETEVLGVGPRESVIILFCLEDRADGANQMHCEARLPITQPALHRYRFTAVNVSGHGGAFPDCEIDAAFDTEAALNNNNEGQLDQNLEISHN